MHPTDFYFFHHRIQINRCGVTGPAELICSPAIEQLFSQYIKNKTKIDSLEIGPLVSFRELSGGGPMFSRFCSNTLKTLESHFSYRSDHLLNRAGQLGAEVQKNPGYDISLSFQAFNNIPIFLNFNNAEDGLPATSAFLFWNTAAKYFDTKHLAILCTFLTGMLINEPNDHEQPLSKRTQNMA